MKKLNVCLMKKQQHGTVSLTTFRTLEKVHKTHKST